MAVCAVLQGQDAIPFLEKLVVGDVQSLTDGTGSLSLMLNESGGIIDDTVITKVSPTEIYMVLNAGCAEKDLAHIKTQLAQHTGDVQLTVHDDRSLLALQGPKAISALQPLVEADLSKVYFSHFRQGLTIAGVQNCFLTRTGCATCSPTSPCCTANHHTHRALLTIRCTKSKSCLLDAAGILQRRLCITQLANFQLSMLTVLFFCQCCTRTADHPDSHGAPGMVCSGTRGRMVLNCPSLVKELWQ